METSEVSADVLRDLEAEVTAEVRDAVRLAWWEGAGGRGMEEKGARRCCASCLTRRSTRSVRWARGVLEVGGREGVGVCLGREGAGVGAGRGLHSSADEESSAASNSGLISDGLPEESYDYMLKRGYMLARKHNPALMTRTIKKLRPPHVQRLGSTRSSWTNFHETSMSIKRTEDHMKDFFLTELNTTGSVTAEGQLVMRGKLTQKMIESLLRRYITEYIMCENCRSLDTSLERDPVTRLVFVKCKSCGASRSVAQIRSGFHAVQRGDRRKARNA
jgi:translation initiation factor 2 subunit 2